MTRRDAAVLFLLVAPALAGRAIAHSLLERSDPRGDSTVKASPAQVRLWFTGAVESAYSRVEVLARQGQRVDIGETVVDAETRKSLTVPVPPLPPAEYRVRWRVLAVDGHVTEGKFTFRVAP